MENLTISDAPPPGHGGALGAGPQPPPTPQLPPQMFTTAAQLLDLTDKKLMVALRDGRKLIGVLRSWDQFANLVLQSTVERIFAPPGPDSDTAGGDDSIPASKALYADVPHGVFLVRGENVMLLGEIDLDKDDDPPPGYELADVEVVKRLAAERKARDKEVTKSKNKKLAALGFEGENMAEILI